MTKKTLSQKLGGLLQRAGQSLQHKGLFNVSVGKGTAIAAYKGIDIANFRFSTDVFFVIYRNNGDVFACIRELYQNVGSNGHTWINTKDGDKDPKKADYAAFDAFLKASGGIDAIKERIVRELNISGNCYFLKQRNGSGKLLKLQDIDARTMSAVCSADGTLIRWIQRVGSRTQQYLPEEVWHIKRELDPNAPIFGLSPLEPIIWEIRTDIAAVLSNYAFFENSARPDTQYILDDSLDVDQQEDVIRKIQDGLKGAENHHKALAVKGVKDVKVLTVSPRDMEYNLLRRFTTEKVCSVLSVPKTVINYTDGVNYSTNDGQYRKFWEGTVQPWNRFIEATINQLGQEDFGVTESGIKFNDRRFDTEESVREDLKLGIITINEAREKRGMPYYDSAEMGEFVDKAIVFNGVSAVPVMDIGQDPQAVPVDPTAADQPSSKAIAKIEELAKRFLYGRPKA